MRTSIILACLGLLLSGACREPQTNLVIPEPQKTAYGKDSLRLSPEVFYDKVLGALVGSAIGDAMGASTEMWHRDDIQRKYGYITGLTPAVRDQSPEGTWEHNLAAGATTDDTRWKLLMVKYFTASPEPSGPDAFTRYITTYYESVATGLADRDIRANPDLLDSKLEKVDWIKEWARVALAYGQGAEAYTQALNRFYGGEMTCAGMLYSPMFGLRTSNPEKAYLEAYDHSLFDHGYAKDITALVSAMTQMALQTTAMDSILDAAVFIDPYRYQDSRLVGRISLQTAQASRKSVWLAGELTLPDSLTVEEKKALRIPDGYPGSAEAWAQQDFIYSFLEEEEQAIPFHAGEIWQILITALEYGQGDFDKTMQFIVNYGRDNDTVAAVAGMILGAKLGFSGLPQDLRNQVLTTNRQQLGIDLEALAKELAGPDENPKL